MKWLRENSGAIAALGIVVWIFVWLLIAGLALSPTRPNPASYCPPWPSSSAGCR